MSAAVFDASVLLKLFFTEQDSDRAALLFDRHRAHAPDWWRAECVSGTWKRYHRSELSADEADSRFEAFARLDVVDHPFAVLLPAASALAIELVHPVYDCLYVALALSEGMPLVTADCRLAKAASKAGVEVVLVGG